MQMHEPETLAPQYITDGDLMRAIFAAGTGIPDPSKVDLWDPANEGRSEVERAFHLMSRFGWELRMLVREYEINLEAERDDGRLTEDIADFIRGVRAISVSAPRIRQRSCAAADHAAAGKKAQPMVVAEEAVAQHFDRMWERGDTQRAAIAPIFPAVEALADDLDRLAASIPPPVRGRPTVPRSTINFVKRAALIFEALRDHKVRASASKEAGDRRGANPLKGSERTNDFVRFIHALCAAAAIEAPKSSAIRAGLQNRP